MDLKLVKVTPDNWRTATFLTTDPERKIPLDEQWIAKQTKKDKSILKQIDNFFI